MQCFTLHQSARDKKTFNFFMYEYSVFLNLKDPFLHLKKFTGIDVQTEVDQ